MIFGKLGFDVFQLLFFNYQFSISLSTTNTIFFKLFMVCMQKEETMTNLAQFLRQKSRSYCRKSHDKHLPCNIQVMYIPGHELELQWSCTRQCKWSSQGLEMTKSGSCERRVWTQLLHSSPKILSGLTILSNWEGFVSKTQVQRFNK